VKGFEKVYRGFSGSKKSERLGVSRPEVPPIYATSVFSFDRLEDMDRVFEGKSHGFIYSRIDNPTNKLLEDVLAELELSEQALVFSSGMAAISHSLMAALKPGDHVVVSDAIYGGSYALFKDILGSWDVEVDFVDIFDVEAVKRSIRQNTKVIYCETISNSMMEVADIPSLSSLAKENGILLFVDNTFASPVLCNPVMLGADVVIHSLTKYINGHSDVTGGMVAGEKTFMEKLLKIRTIIGGCMSPFDAWLTLRGIKTLHARMKVHSENAMALARLLENHPKVGKVYYPGLERQKTYGIARKVLEGGFGGMLSFELLADEAELNNFLENLELIELVPSLASVSTILSIPAKTSHRAVPEDVRLSKGISNSLIRLSVGIEPLEVIWKDISNSLDKLS